MSEYFEDEEPEGEDMIDTSKATGDGITVQINAMAMERIESAAVAGLSHEITRKIDKLIESKIAAIVTEKLGEVVGRLADAAILEYLTKPRPRTNAWGEPTSGTPMTIADQIPEKVAAFLAEKVTDNGNPDRNYGKVGRVEWILGKMVRDQLDAATKAAASSVTEQAKKVVAAHVGRFVAEQMIPQIDVSKASR